MQAIVELALERPFKLRMLQVALMNMEEVCVDRDRAMLQLNSDFHSVALLFRREIKQWMFVQSKLRADEL